MYADGTCPSTTAPDGTVTRESCPDAYGMVLGMLSFVLKRYLELESFLFLFRNFTHMLVPRNLYVICISSCIEKGFPANGYW